MSRANKWVIVGDTALGPASGVWTGDGWTLSERKYPAREYATRLVAEKALRAMDCREYTNARVVRR